MAHILIAGGGVAAVEAVAALRAQLGLRPRITLLAPQPRIAERPSAVGTPFGFGAPHQLPLDVVAGRAPFDLRIGKLVDVDTCAHQAITDWGEPLAYDYLLVTVGARTRPAVDGAITFTGHADAAAVEEAVQECDRLAFVQPVADGWSLPVYELAIMAAVQRPGVRVTVVTAEPEPLAVFGAEAGAAVGALLAERGIELRAGVRAVAAHPGRLELEDGSVIATGRTIALPSLAGPAIHGLPHDDAGFIPVDAHGRVHDAPDVFAAGDATDHAIKQGGLAAQQADAAAQAIAARLDTRIVPEPYRPVLRAQLLTGGAPLYMRRTPDGDTAVSRRPLWSPPGKIAGRYLAPLLATARPPVLADSPLQDLHS
jgi:sulfide:quinone oxidoreductase